MSSAAAAPAAAAPRPLCWENVSVFARVFAKVYCFKQGLKIFHIKRNGFALLSFFPLVLLLVFL